MTFEEIPQKYPRLGLAVYMLEPGNGFTLEIHTPDDQVFTFHGATLQQAVDRAFPPEPAPPAPKPRVDLFA